MKICVIGGGASGMIAAGFAKNENNQVVLFEKNEKLGKKIYITGKGRCNVTNNTEVQEFMKNVVSNPKFLTGCLYSFTPNDLMQLIEENGVKLKTERGNRVFPVSDKSSDIIKALEHFVRNSGVEVRLNENVVNIAQNEKFIIKTDLNEYTFDKVIIATGGLSYKSTGSTGDGYKFAKLFGHSITELKAGLTSISLKDEYIAKLEGISLKNVTLNTYINGKKKFEEFGEMLFTKNGISGPIVLTTSSKIAKFKQDEVSFTIDFKPALDYVTLNNRLLREFNANINKNVSNVISELLPSRLVSAFLDVCNINEYKKVNTITKQERQSIITNLKAFPITFEKVDKIDNAVITIGGVKTSEINSATMESKIISGLYFAGEVIDVDALTGGYNLQIAFSTGYVAGKNASY